MAATTCTPLIICPRHRLIAGSITGSVCHCNGRAHRYVPKSCGHRHFAHLLNEKRGGTRNYRAPPLHASADYGLVEPLSGKGPFTIFAPTNEAFAKLPAGTVASLTPEQLKSILTYHVVAGEVLAKDVKPGKVKTVNGAELTINVKDGKVSITDAKGNTVNVVKPDIVGSNGVIHVIDGVLMP